MSFLLAQRAASEGPRLTRAEEDSLPASTGEGEASKGSCGMHCRAE
jgi:hypothetical protein